MVVIPCAYARRYALFISVENGDPAILPVDDDPLEPEVTVQTCPRFPPWHVVDHVLTHTPFTHTRLLLVQVSVPPPQPPQPPPPFPPPELGLRTILS